ncbi:MFS transporter [Luteimicrobium xylanilyticum]|uniref:2-nitroimidazole transporter n=1 Tax=Luteimicrobium xylanilyticum TaxID=1133546 RepID=A0A5P9QBH4_9MICO|nr:MFS transporter [Luteimicrobium xylanilyticum]QFU97795.1 2-nitroimidazole transporter [Luteimicrobium xylanilyticum]
MNRPTAVARAPRGWLALVGVLLVAANLRASITTVGPVLDDVQRDLRLSSAAGSALISLPLVAFAVVSPVTPALARRLGLERALAGALALLAAGIVLRSVPGPGLLWVGTVLLGVAIAVLNVVLPAVVKRDHPTRIGTLTGAYSAVQASFAALAAGLAVPVAGAATSGWRLALGIWAGLAVVALAFVLPQPSRPSVVAAAEDAQALDDTAPEILPDAAGTRSARTPWRTALGWQVTLFMGLQSVTFYVLITWLPSVEHDHGVGASAAGVHLLLLNGCGIVGSLCCSALLHRVPDQRPLGLAGPLLFAAAVAGMLGAPGAAAAWACVAGVAGGLCIVLALSLFGLRTTDHHQAASLSGMAQSVGYLLAAAGPIAFGALHDATGSWRVPLVVLLGVSGGQAVFGTLAGRARKLT